MISVSNSSGCVAVERIYPDRQWEMDCCTKLDDFFSVHDSRNNKPKELTSLFYLTISSIIMPHYCDRSQHI